LWLGKSANNRLVLLTWTDLDVDSDVQVEPHGECSECSMQKCVVDLLTGQVSCPTSLLHAGFCRIMPTSRNATRGNRKDIRLMTSISSEGFAVSLKTWWRTWSTVEERQFLYS
jgi:hypothetical protein